MNARYILQESHCGRIAPLPHFGLYVSRRKAKKAAKAMGLPPNLITAVRRKTT
jgi:hypothetical protein